MSIPSYRKKNREKNRILEKKIQNSTAYISPFPSYQFESAL